MRITISVREGDFATTEVPFGADIAYLMAASGAFDGVVRGASGSERWTKLSNNLRATTCVAEIDPSDSLADLMAAALGSAISARKASAEAVTGRCWLADPATDKKYNPQATASSAGLVEGDLVVLNIEHPPLGMYQMLPAPNAARLFSQLQLTDRAERFAGVLLYTDADVELATFVRTHFDELNALSGDLFQIFVQERPTSWRKAKQYWKPRADPQLYQLLAALQWLKWVPYDRSEAYEIARRFGVPPTDLPCLVLLDPNGERFVFPLQEASISEFRRLFSDLSTTIHGDLPPRVTLERQLDRLRGWGYDEPLNTEAIPARLAEAEKRFRAALVPLQDQATYQFKGTTLFVHVGGDAVTENFNFHGPTTFINRPTDTVITDFQNTYSAAPAAKDLAGLLRLVLTSRELPDESREWVAQQIHELADDLDDPAIDHGGVRTKLEWIKSTVGQAADIAGPALGIVAKILELLP